MDTPLRILFVEDSEDDALLLVRQIKTGGYAVTFERVESAASMTAAMEAQAWDLVISDYAIPGFNGFAALTLFKKKGIDIPFIMVSGTIGEHIAVEAMKAGAHDYVMKTNLARLAPAIARELRDAAVRLERKRLEEQFRQAQKMEAFGQLAAGVAHDFNNILTVIQGNLSLLRMDRLSVPERTTAFEQAFSASERAANLTRQLLTFSRRQPLQPRNLDLNGIVVNVTKMLQRLIGEHIALEARYAPGGALVHADPGMMEQTLVNLAVNSRDAMPKGGRMSVETAIKTITEADTLENSRRRTGEYVILTVSDSGTGIAPEHLPHIFEPFFTTKAVGEGTGLGLATVFGIVDQHHGWIEVESQTDKGTSFHIYMPRLTAINATLAKPPMDPDVRGGDETILLVEDEAAVQELMQRLLTHYGYRVHLASSGAAALKIWQNHRQTIDLLLTDMVMPEGVSGRELADEMRSQKPELRVVYCSGYTDDMLGKDSPLRNNVNFLEKPFEVCKFLRMIRNSLDAR